MGAGDSLETASGCGLDVDGCYGPKRRQSPWECREKGQERALRLAEYCEGECLCTSTHAVPFTALPFPFRPLAEILLPFMALQMLSLQCPLPMGMSSHPTTLM